MLGTPVAMWLVAFSATGAAAVLSWTAHRLRKSVEVTLAQVEANERRTVEHRLALKREGVDVPDLALDPEEEAAYSDRGD